MLYFEINDQHQLGYSSYMFKQKAFKEMFGAKVFRYSNLRILNVIKGDSAWLSFKRCMDSENFLKFN